jgi:hypothetical protein
MDEAVYAHSAGPPTRSPVAASPKSSLRITVVSTLSEGLVEKGAPDVSMVKGAMLYGDSVRLFSLHASGLLPFLSLRELNFEQKLKFIRGVAPAVGGAELVAEAERMIPLMRELDRKKGKQKHEVLRLSRARAQLDDLFRMLADMTAGIEKNAGTLPILKDAVRTGLVSIHEFKSLPPGSALDYGNREFTDRMVGEFVQVVREVVEDGATYPLLDEQASTLVSAMVSAGQLSPSDATQLRSKSVALASQLFHRLPTFDRATIDEIVDIRRELEKPLVRFRSGMLDLSSRMSNAAWDEAFPEEADILAVREVEPAVLEIEEQVQANKYLRQLLSDIADKPVMPVGGTFLSLVVAPATHLPPLFAHALLGGSVAGLTALNTYRNWREEQLKIEGNQFYFYYGVRQRLSINHQTDRMHVTVKP